MAKLSLSAMEKLLREAGAERVSKAAKMALSNALVDRSKEIGQKAARLALHSGRKTVTEEDVRLALKEKK